MRSRELQERENPPGDQTVEAIAQIEHEAYNARSKMDHIASATTRAAGTGVAIVLHVLWFLIWILANLQVLPAVKPFDPFPFPLLATIVGLEVIFLTLFVLMSQNRIMREADKRAQLDLQVNLLAEKEATMILRMLKEISVKLEVTEPSQEDLHALLQDTRVDELSEKLKTALPDS